MASGFGLDFGVCESMHACACVCIHNHNSDMYGPILFLLSRKITHVAIHMHIILFRDVIKDGRLEAILVVEKLGVEHVLNHFSDMYLPMLFKLGTQIKNDSLHKHVNFFEINPKMAASRPSWI